MIFFWGGESGEGENNAFLHFFLEKQWSEQGLYLEKGGVSHILAGKFTSVFEIPMNGAIKLHQKFHHEC